MATSQLTDNIDLISTVTLNQKSNSSNSSMASNSNDFENILKTANNNYTKDTKDTTDTTAKKVVNTKNTDNTKKTTQNIQDTNDKTVQSDSKPQVNNNDDKNQNITDKQTVQQEQNTETKNTKEVTTQQENNKQATQEDIKNTETEAVNVDNEIAQEQEITPNVINVENKDNKEVMNVNAEKTTDTQTSADELKKLQENQVPPQDEDLISQNTQKAVKEVKNDKITENKEEVTPFEKIAQTLEETLNIPTSQGTETTDNTKISSEEEKTPIQPLNIELQEIPAEVNVASMWSDVDIQSSIENLTTLNTNNTKTLTDTNVQIQKNIPNKTSDIKNVPEQTSNITTSIQNEITGTAQTSEMPLVSVAEDIITNSATDLVQDTNLPKDAKITTNKTDLTQKVLDDMDVKITKVETTKNNSATNTNTNTNQNSSNLLSQNTEEQAIKLELNPEADAKDITTTKSTETNNVNPILDAKSNLTQIQSNTQTSATAQFQAPKDLTQNDIITQINKQLNTKNLQSGETKISMILKPENLGKLELEIVNTKDGLTAQLTTENIEVKSILEKSLNTLKDTLGNQGVNVNNVTVKVSETQKQDTMFSFEDNQRQGQPEQNQEKGTKQTTNGKASTAATSDDEEDIQSSDNTEQSREKEVKIATARGRIDYKI